MFFGPSKRDRQILSTINKTVIEQLTGIMKMAQDDYGNGIQYIIVESRFFENVWVFYYISGWIEGYCRATRLKERYWSKAIDNGVNEAAWFFEYMYEHQGKKLQWKKSLNITNPDNQREGLEAGMREGSEVGIEICEFIDKGVFPKSEKLMFNSLGVKLRQGNEQAVNMIKNEALNGDKFSMELLRSLR